jgi:hypothetical protein
MIYNYTTAMTLVRHLQQQQKKTTINLLFFFLFLTSHLLPLFLIFQLPWHARISYGCWTHAITQVIMYRRPRTRLMMPGTHAQNAMPCTAPG